MVGTGQAEQQTPITYCVQQQKGGWREQQERRRKKTFKGKRDGDTVDGEGEKEGRGEKTQGELRAKGKKIRVEKTKRVGENGERQ